MSKKNILNKHNNQVLLEIKNLDKQFDNNYILKNIDFSISAGELVSITGHSGVGKTSFINILLGLDKEFGGQYEKYCNKIAAVFQEDRLLPWLNIYQNLKIVNPKISDSKIKEILDVMKLTDFVNFSPLKLSGGMKQRVAIARALCYDAELIIMDEPLKSTDSNLSNKILEYLKLELKTQYKSLIMITHDINNAIQISDSIYILENKPACFVKKINVNNQNKDEITKELNKYNIISMEENMNRIPGHELLARLGKTRLRPGGVTATNWLIEKANFTENTKVLEVACNMGTTIIEIAKKYNCKITGLDKDENFLSQAKTNVAKAGLENNITLLHGDARTLPFEDESFDVVINEAMLTMLTEADKQKAVSEYFRVLKKGGILLTHDVSLPVENDEVVKELRKVINVLATPLTEQKWIELFQTAGFNSVVTKTDHMTLMSKEGMQKDEGEAVMKQIFEKAKSDPNFQQFIEMKDFFARNNENLFYIAVCSKK